MASIPGVPNLLRNAPRAIGITILGNAVNALWNFLFPGPQWGIFLPGSADRAIEVSSVVELAVAASARASDYPIQSGSFINYNKVRLPDVFGVRITLDLGDQDKAFLMSWLDTNTTEPSLFDIVCPERRWANSTLTDYRINRSASSGASMLVVDCLFQQIRELPATYSRQNIASPENEPSTPTARVNPQPVEPNSAGGAVSWQ